VNISIQKLIAKIEEELRQAKTAQRQESLREKVYSIKILCELILDEKPVQPSVSTAPVEEVKVQSAAVQSTAQPIFQQPVVTQQILQPPPSIQQGKKIEMDDEANGDSLFDF
jgi:hypothetical protein